jgi:hypothetical protein
MAVKNVDDSQPSGRYNGVVRLLKGANHYENQSGQAENQSREGGDCCVKCNKTTPCKEIGVQQT